MYAFPIQEYYNATNFSRDQFLDEAGRQSRRFAESYLVVTDTVGMLLPSKATPQG